MREPASLFPAVLGKLEVVIAAGSKD